MTLRVQYIGEVRRKVQGWDKRVCYWALLNNRSVIMTILTEISGIKRPLLKLIIRLIGNGSIHAN